MGSKYQYGFAPDGSQIIISEDEYVANDILSFEREQALSPYLRVDEQANYDDVICDGYTLRVYHGDQSNNGVIEFFVNGSNIANIGPSVRDSGNTLYFLGQDPNRSVDRIIDTPNLIAYRIKGDHETSAQAALANEDYVEVVYYIYPDRIFTDYKWVTTGDISLSASVGGSMTIGWDPASASITNEVGIYENSGSENEGTGAYNNADYIGSHSDEIIVMGLTTYVSDTTGNWTQYIGSTDTAVVFQWYNTTKSAATYRIQGVLIFDSQYREGSAEIYDSTDRLAMGDTKTLRLT
jgi:hypothetical protein